MGERRWVGGWVREGGWVGERDEVCCCCSIELNLCSDDQLVLDSCVIQALGSIGFLMAGSSTEGDFG